MARTGIIPMAALLGAALTIASVAPMFFSAPPSAGPTPKTHGQTTISALDHVVFAAPGGASAQLGKDSPAKETAVESAVGPPRVVSAVELGHCGGGSDRYIGQGSFRS